MKGGKTRPTAFGMPRPPPPVAFGLAFQHKVLGDTVNPQSSVAVAPESRVYFFPKGHPGIGGGVSAVSDTELSVIQLSLLGDGLYKPWGGR